MRISTLAGLIICAAVAWTSTEGSSAQAAIRTMNVRSNATIPGSRNVVYVSDRTENKVMVYPLNGKTPVGSITRGIVEAEGLAVDKAGDLFVANGNGANVLEYGPGGSGPIRSLTRGLHHPVNVTVDAAGNIYVAEQSPSSIVKFGPEPGTIPRVYPLPYPNDPVRGVAVDAGGNIFASISGLQDTFPLSGNCLAVSALYVIPAGSPMPILKSLNGNEQAFGLALDAGGTLYAADPCLSNVAAYGLPSMVGEGFFRNATAFNQPFYLTMANGYLSVPSGGEATQGYVTIVSMTSPFTYYVINNGLRGPISAVVGSSRP